MAIIKKIKKIKKKPHKSFNQIETYLRCPKQYKFRYIDKIKKEGFVTDLVIGDYVHKFIAEILTKKLNSRTPKEKEIKETKEAIKNNLNLSYKNAKEKNLPISGSVNVSNIVTLFDLLTTEWVKEILPEFKPLAIEKELRFDIVGHEFLMYIDAIRELSKNKKQVVDWKVANKRKSFRDIESSLQLCIYSYATGIENVAFTSIVKPKTITKKSSIDISTVVGVKGSVDYKWLEEIVRGVIEGMEKEYFPVCHPSNYLCNSLYCDYWNICRGKDIKEIDWI